MKYETKQREIGMTTLFYQIFRRWRGILAFGLIGALLGMGSVAMKINQNQGEAVVSESTDAVEAYAADNQNFTDAIARAEDQLKERRAYLANTVLAEIDPGHEAKAVALFAVTGDSADFSAEQAASAAAAELQYGTDWDAIAVKLGTEAEYVSELVNVTPFLDTNHHSDAEVNDMNSVITVHANQPASVVMVSVIHSDKDKANQILQAVIAHAEEVSADQSVFAGYELELTNQYSGYYSDDDMMTWLNARLNEIANINTNKERLQASQDKLSKPSISSGRVSGKSIIKKCVKFAVLGFFAGVLILILCMAIWFAISGRVLSAAELCEQFGIRLIAVIPDQKAKRGWLDRWISRLDTDDKNLQSEEVAYKLGTRNLIAFAEDCKKLILVGDVTVSDMESLRSSLNMDGEKPYHIQIAGDLNTDPDALDLLADADGAILVARIGKSSYAKTVKIAGVLQSWKKEIVGTIVL